MVIQCRGISSVGRVLRSHRRGQEFEPPILHFPKNLNVADKTVAKQGQWFLALDDWPETIMTKITLFV